MRKLVKSKKPKISNTQGRGVEFEVRNGLVMLIGERSRRSQIRILLKLMSKNLMLFKKSACQMKVLPVLNLTTRTQ